MLLKLNRILTKTIKSVIITTFTMATAKCNTLNVSTRDVAGYLPIENYGMIGNMRTCALVSMDGSVGRFKVFKMFKIYFFELWSGVTNSKTHILMEHCPAPIRFHVLVGCLYYPTLFRGLYPYPLNYITSLDISISSKSEYSGQPIWKLNTFTGQILTPRLYSVVSWISTKGATSALHPLSLRHIQPNNSIFHLPPSSKLVISTKMALSMLWTSFRALNKPQFYLPRTSIVPTARPEVSLRS